MYILLAIFLDTDIDRAFPSSIKIGQKRRRLGFRVI
jgi:hypothetical protein